MNNDEDNYIHLRSYSKIWRVEKRLEHINGVKLNASIPLEHATYFIAILGPEMFLWLKIPFLKQHVSVVVLILIALLFSTFLKKVKLDGRSPVRFFRSLLEFVFECKSYSHFRELKVDTEIYYNDLIAYRKDTIKKRAYG